MSDVNRDVENLESTQRTPNRADDTTNDKPPISITLLTVDETILKFLANRIKPVVTQDNKMIQVPVIYGDPERWKSAQRDGVLRDTVGKIQLPLIMVKRGPMKKAGINSPVNKYLDRSFSTGWNSRTPYDRFNLLNNIGPSRKYYVTTTPDYYELQYDCLIWTEYQSQMNKVVENIAFESDEFWGEPNSYKFRVMVNSFEPINELPANGDRVVRTRFSMKVHAYLLPEDMLNKGLNRGPVTRVRYGAKKLVNIIEVDE